MAVASIVSKRTYIARESVVGTAQPANKFLEGLNIRINSNTTVGDVRPSGSTMSVDRPLIQNWSTFTLADGSYLDYNSALYLFSALMGVPTTTTPVGGTLSREHAFAYSADGLNTRPTFTVVSGYRGGTAEQTVRNVFQSIGFGFSRTAAPTVSGSGYGRIMDLSASVGVNEIQSISTASGTITAGTFTATLNGGTVSILWNANAGSIAGAIGTLPGVGGTANVTVTGGSLPATPATITFSGGTIANSNVPAIVVSSAGLTGGTLQVTEVQAGGITTVPVKSVTAPQWSVYIDAIGGTVGTTKFRPYTCEFAFGGLVNPDWVIDAATTSYDDDILQVPTLTANVMMRNDTAARALYASCLAGDSQLMRFEAVGPVIEGVLTYLLRVDMAVKVEANVGQFGDQGGSETMAFPFVLISDSTVLSGAFTGLIRNVLASM